MPAKSAKQQRFMGMCSHSDHPPDRCPSKKVAREFARKGKTMLTGRKG
jgi:hypothetical protein